jgi:hypothetical protein
MSERERKVPANPHFGTVRVKECPVMSTPLNVLVRPHRSLAALLLGMTLVACSPDTPVPAPPCKGDACPADITEDTGGDITLDTADVPVTPTLNFSLETKNGTALSGTTNSATLAFTDDKYADTPGTQVDVVVTSKGLPDGTDVQLAVDNKVVASAKITGNTARFDKQTIACSTVQLTYSVSTKDGATKVGKAIQLDCSGGCTATLEDPGAACLTSDVDPGTPGFQATFTVKTTTPDCTDAYIQFTDENGKTVTSDKVPLNGASSVAVKVTLNANDKNLVGSKIKLTAVVEDTAHEGRASIPSDPSTVTVTTQPPVITILQPLPGQLTLKDDTDPNTPGIQTTLVGTATTLTTADANAIQLFVDGTLLSATTLKVDDTFQFALSFPESKTYSIKVTATSACGLSVDKTVPYSVFASKAALVVQSPTPGQVLLAKDDGNGATGSVYETSFVIGTLDPTISSEIQVFCKKNAAGSAYGNDPVGSLIVTDVTATSLAVPVALDVDLLGTDIVCFAKDNAPNPSQTVEVAFQVGLPAPCLTVVQPAGAVTSTTAKLDFAASAVGLDGAEVMATLTNAAGAQYDAIPLGKVQKGVLQAKLPLQFGTPAQNLPDGTYTIHFDAADAFGNLASASLCSDTTRTVTLDTTGPVLAISLPTKATLTTLDDPDADVAQPGYQIAVMVDATDAKQVCLSVSGAKVGCLPGGAGLVQVTFPSVTLQPGLNTLEVSGTDASGNLTTLPGQPLMLVSDSPSVTFVSPAASLSTINDSLVFQAKVADGAGLGVSGAVTEVRINGKADATIAVTDKGDGFYTFTVGNLSAGVTTVQFGAAASGSPDKIGYSTSLTVTFKNTKPSATFSSPADGAVLNLASASCVAGVPDCITTIQVAAANVEDGVEATLSVNCGGPDVSYKAKVASAQATFDAVALNDQATCSIVASVTDLAGQQATSAKVTVSVDRTAPAFLSLDSPSAPDGVLTLLAGNDLNKDQTDGMQVNIQIKVSGLPKGAKIQLDVFDDTGKKTNTVSCTVLADVSDKASEIVSCGVVSLPDGLKVKLQFSAADLAGNPASKSLVGQILSSSPDMNINGPSNVLDIACKANSDCFGGVCYQGKCVVPWNKLATKTLTLSTVGVPNGGAVRICSDAPGLTGDPCATAGFKIVATGTVQSQTSEVSLASVPDGIYTFMAEVSFLPSVPWTSSFNSTFINGKKRRILIDTVSPSIVSFSAPTAAGVPNTCLSDKLQDSTDLGLPGGKFTFAVTTDEETTIVLQNDKLQVATGQTLNKAAAISAALPNEGTVTLSAVPVDLVGNIGAGKDLAALLVNTVAPTGSFAVPNKAKLLVGDSLDVKIVSSAADVQDQPVTLHDTGKALAVTQTFSNGVAIFLQSVTGALSDGSHSLTADLVDQCGNKSTIASIPATVVVDTQAPVLAFVEPSVAATFTDNQDADPVKTGYQVGVQFGTSDAATWTLDLGTDCDAAFSNCAGFQTVASGNVAVPGGNEPKLLVTVPFGNTANYSLRLKGVDSNGNISSLERGFTVTLTGCLVQLKGLPAGVLNTQSCATKGQSCGSVTLPISVTYLGPCGNVTEIQLLKNGTKLAGAAPTDQAATFDLVVSDADNFQLEGAAVQAGTIKGSSGALPVQADLTNPSAKFVAGTVLGQATVSGDVPVQLGKSKDLDPVAAGHQVHAQLKIDDVGLNGGKLVSIKRAAGSAVTDLVAASPKVPSALSGTSALIDVQFATLAEDATNVVTATVQDAAGNLGTASFTATVDWQAPSAIVLNAFGTGDLNPRRPLAKLTFNATGDNAGVGAATAYDVRYSKKPIASEADFTAACDAKVLAGTVTPKPGAAGSLETVTISGPDPRDATDPCKFAPLSDNGATKYYFAVEALDVAGNRSPLSNVLATDGLRLRFANLLLGGTNTASELHVRVWPVGDLNGDGLGDFALGGGLSAPVCIVYGHAGLADGTLPDMDLTTASGTNHICLTNTGGLGAPVGRARDLNGDGVDDLALGASTGAGLPRVVNIYLGKKGAKISGVAAVTVKNLYNVATNGVSRVNGIGNFNGDANAATKLALNDLAFLDRGTGATSTLDRVRILPGSAKWSEATPLTIDINNATERANNNVVTIQEADQVSGSVFGYFVGGGSNVLPDGDGTGAQFDDLLIGQYASPQQLIVVKGRAVTGDTLLVLSSASDGSGAADATTVRLRPDTLTGVNSFGQFADVVEFDGNATPDLVIQHNSNLTGQPQGGLYFVRGASLASQLGKVVVLNVTALAGTTDLYSTALGYMRRLYVQGVFNIGNFFDQPGTSPMRTDIAFGRNQKAPNGASNLISFSQDLLRPGTAIPTENSFLTSDLAFGDPVKPGNSTWAIGPDTGWGGIAFAPLADFNGDGLPDLVVGSVDGGLLIVY